MSYMGHVSRPLIALLVGTVAFFAVWTVALKPKSGGGNGSSGTGAGTFQSAIDKAHQAVTTSNKASVAHGGTVVTSATTPAPGTATTPAPTAGSTKAGTAGAAGSAKAGASGTATTASVTATAPKASAATKGTTKGREHVVAQALRSRKVVALLFFNPLASDDRAVAQELASISGQGGKVVKLAVPLKELPHYEGVTNQVEVNSSPTLVLIDRARQATTIVGYASTFEIAHRIDDALAVK
jgi:hypothetical protein